MHNTYNMRTRDRLKCEKKKKHVKKNRAVICVLSDTCR